MKEGASGRTSVQSKQWLTMANTWTISHHWYLQVSILHLDFWKVNTYTPSPPLHFGNSQFATLATFSVFIAVKCLWATYVNWTRKYIFPVTWKLLELINTRQYNILNISFPMENIKELLRYDSDPRHTAHQADTLLMRQIPYHMTYSIWYHMTYSIWYHMTYSIWYHMTYSIWYHMTYSIWYHMTYSIWYHMTYSIWYHMTYSIWYHMTYSIWYHMTYSIWYHMTYSIWYHMTYSIWYHMTYSIWYHMTYSIWYHMTYSIWYHMTYSIWYHI